ncbi:MAG: DUF4912 domain-containing protein [Limisphaerales bacterium]
MKLPKKSSRKTVASPKPPTKAAKTKPPRSRRPLPPEPESKPRQTPLKIPPILLEGDLPATVRDGGPGQRYSLAPAPPAKHWGTVEPPSQLPEAYGTGQLLLTARDPHWLYAHWDLTREQQAAYNSRAGEHRLVLRIYLGEAGGTPLKEVHLHAESRHWFVRVDHADARYVAEFGYYQPDGCWVSISTSRPTLTPPDTLSADASVQFATIPFEVPFEKLLEEVKVAVSEHVPLIEAVQRLREAGHPQLPVSIKISPAEWTPAEEKALAEVVAIDTARQVWIGSLEITELVRRQLEKRLTPTPGAPSAPPTSWLGAGAAVTSPGGVPAAAPSKNEFWFNVNAELIVYGSTEPDALVSIGGRLVPLRPDGTFSFRFALPDGRYTLPAIAVSPRGVDTRRADLRFTRSTSYRGHVGAHPQDPSLETPGAT